MNNQPFLQIEQGDNLIVALRDIAGGTEVDLKGIVVTIREDIPAKQKFSLVDLKVGDTAIMYGVIVGKATRKIPAGALVSTANLKHATTTYQDQHEKFIWQPPPPYANVPAEFMGVRRADGQAGTANYWIFVPLVFCSNQELLQLKKVLVRALGYSGKTQYDQYADTLAAHVRSGGLAADATTTLESFDHQEEPIFPNVDGLRFLTHHLGCGTTPDDVESLCALLADYISHPNVAGATVISLGCQHAEISMLKEALRETDPDGLKPVFYYDRQSWSEPGDMHEAIIHQTFDSLQEANKVVRESLPISELVVGVECGASDGFSGISANPIIGRTMDHFVGAGASAILSEFPELCGVENELVSRCTSPRIAQRFLKIIEEYRKKVQFAGSDFAFNPSPGNIRDGLITDAMKSAGAAKKGGTSPVVDVLDYTETLKKRGLNLLCTPGGDVESMTALAGSGANLLIFSTGLGTPTGNAIVPTIKVSSNSDMARRLESMIDFDTGPIITGEKTIDELAGELQRLCIETASGRYETKASRLGQEDFIPWKRGVSL